MTDEIDNEPHTCAKDPAETDDGKCTYHLWHNLSDEVKCGTMCHICGENGPVYVAPETDDAKELERRILYVMNRVKNSSWDPGAVQVCARSWCVPNSAVYRIAEEARRRLEKDYIRGGDSDPRHEGGVLDCNPGDSEEIRESGDAQYNRRINWIRSMLDNCSWLRTSPQTYADRWKLPIEAVERMAEIARAMGESRESGKADPARILESIPFPEPWCVQVDESGDRVTIIPDLGSTRPSETELALAVFHISEVKNWRKNILETAIQMVKREKGEKPDGNSPAHAGARARLTDAMLNREIVTLSVNGVETMEGMVSDITHERLRKITSFTLINQGLEARFNLEEPVKPPKDEHPGPLDSDNPGADRMRLIHPELGKALDILGEINIEDPADDDWERVPRAVAAILGAGMAWERELEATAMTTGFVVHVFWRI